MVREPTHLLEGLLPVETRLEAGGPGGGPGCAPVQYCASIIADSRFHVTQPSSHSAFLNAILSVQGEICRTVDN